ncbi:unnamed protein product [Chondrus crispus]|uniref:Secreted protein n=1 Tax=Chondrus crispus TaxID=2769 RepID=R7QFV1_CHOCR|nr:unnamed protein product [Chondrus crispus]CDF36300.1 unnamed protein product [Chondrus crispus]|eukprot:XP_005716119.1 unnamed protein product [Chondrus crispus]
MSWTFVILFRCRSLLSDLSLWEKHRTRSPCRGINYNLHRERPATRTTATHQVIDDRPGEAYAELSRWLSSNVKSISRV